MQDLAKGTNEIKQLSLINKAIEDKVLDNVAVIYEPHPWGQGGKGGHAILDYDWKYISIDQSMLYI